MLVGMAPQTEGKGTSHPCLSLPSGRRGGSSQAIRLHRALPPLPRGRVGCAGRRWGDRGSGPLAPAGTRGGSLGRPPPPRPGWPASRAPSRVMSAACRQVWMFCQRSRVYDHPQMCIQEHTVPTAEINAGLTAGQAAYTGERKKENKNCLMLFINYTLADEKYISPSPPLTPILSASRA